MSRYGLAGLFVAGVVAGWATSGLSGVVEFPVCTASGAQFAPSVCGDMVIWQDLRDPNLKMDIWAYNLTSKSTYKVCPALYAAGGVQTALTPTTVMWTDKRNGNWDIYGYDLKAKQEVVICKAPGDKTDLAAFGDVIVWADHRNAATTGWDVYGYRLSTKQEFPVCVHSGDQIQPAIYSNTVVWIDQRSNHTDLYTCDIATKTESKILVSPGTNETPSIYGNVVVWTRMGSGPSGIDVYGYNLQTKQESAITTNACAQHHPVIWKNTVVYLDNDAYDYGAGTSDVWGYDMDTKDRFLVSHSMRFKYEVRIWGNNVVWSELRNDATSRDIFGARLTGSTAPQLKPVHIDKIPVIEMRRTLDVQRKQDP